MPSEDNLLSPYSEAINRGFTRQSLFYDQADKDNPVLQDLRKQVYAHVGRYLQPGSRILELNAGTGLDAVHFILSGHQVHATDLSDGMVDQIRLKMAQLNLPNAFTCQQLSFDRLDQVYQKNFNYVFSNFGGLNCIQDLSLVGRHLPSLLKPNAYVTWVVMPPVCISELLWIFKGQWKKAFRRFKKDGTLTHVEGAYFKTYYHSLRTIASALGPSFKLLESEGLAALSPQPHHKTFAINNPWLYRILRKLDSSCKNTFPFNLWADHLIVTFQFRP